MLSAAPAFGAPLLAAQQGALYSYSVVLSDVDTDPATLTLTEISGLPLWLTLDTVNRELKGTPGNDDVGDHFITLQASDGINFTEQSFMITVANVNDAPAITSALPTTTITEGDTFSYTVIASDIDLGDNLALSISALPSWLDFNAGNGLLSSNAPAVIGSYPVTITVTDDGTVPSALNATQVFTIVVSAPGTPIDMTLLMSGTEGGVRGIDDSNANEYRYWTDDYNSGTGVLTFADYEYNHSTGVFETIVFGNDFVLNGGLWVAPDINNVIAVDDGNGGLNISVQSAAGILLENANLTARFVDIGGELIANYLDSVWQGAMVDTNAVFNTNAKLITEYRFETLMDIYFLEVQDWCQGDGTSRYVDLGNDCNGIDLDAGGFAQVLSDVVVATAWVDPDDFTTPPGSIFVAGAANIALKVQLVSGGVANYYVINWGSLDAASFVEDAVAGSWVQNSDPGVEMIQARIPSSLVARFPDLSRGLNRFLTVRNGFVRSGRKNVVGDVDRDRNIFNGNAMTDVLDNFSAPPLADLSNVVGTWVSTLPSSNGDPFVMHFSGNGYYEVSGTCDLSFPATTGMDYGTYTTNGVITSLMSSTSACSPARGIANGNTIIVSGDVMTITIANGGGDVVFSRLQGAANPIVGSWIQGNIQDPGESHTILTFLDGSTFVLSQDCVTDGVSGFEYGSYIWDQGNTNELSGNLGIDSNGSCGIHDNNGLVFSGYTLTVNGDTLTINVPGAGDVFFTRHTAAIALTCNYDSGWNDALGQPLNFNSLTDFETVVADCGNALSIVAADMVGTWVDSYTDIDGDWVETIVFVSGGTGTFSATLNGVLNESGAFTWSVSGDRYFIEGLDLGVVTYREVGALLADGTQKAYAEDVNWPQVPDLIFDGNADGEIWSGSMTKQ